MPGPTHEDFAQVVQRTDDLTPVVSDVVFGGIPHVFESDPDAWDFLRGGLSSALACEQEDVLVVGSAKMGYSLAPRKYGRPFLATSDIDVIVISAALYDEVWHAVLKWHYRRRHRLPPPDRAWDEQRRDDMYWGYLNPVGFKYRGLTRSAQLRPAMRVSTAWFNAFQGLSRTPAFAGRKVNGRLYRTRQHALSYHDHGLRELKRALRDAEEVEE